MNKILCFTLFLLIANWSVANEIVGKRYDFLLNNNIFKSGWKFQGKLIGVNRTEFEIVKSPLAQKGNALRVEANKASGVIMNMPKVDPAKYPIIRWRWRLIKPINFEKNILEPDDQAIVIYVGDGTIFKRRSVAYRWEHNYPVGSADLMVYGGGTISVKHYCLRNRTAKLGEWILEERNYFQDYQHAFGKSINKEFIVGIGANSQYTKSHTIAEIDYIEFCQK